MTTRADLTHAIRNVAYMEGHDQEERMSRSSALIRLRRIDIEYGDLFDAIDHDKTARAYDLVDRLIEARRLPHADD